ncbi:MAG: hypothetical protein IGS23_02830 [Rivularia sp. T60_A2020_040]|nr:hypothetical protein [Rivularia sp. T60_A2020_040]
MVKCGLGIGAAIDPPSNTIARNILRLVLKLPVGIIFHSEASFPGY